MEVYAQLTPMPGVAQGAQAVIAWSALLNDATRLFFEDSRLKAYIETQPWGEDFIKAYYAINSGIDIANIAQGALLAIHNNSNKVRSVLIQNKATQRELELFDTTVNKTLLGSGSKVGKYSLEKISQEQGFIDLLPGLLKKEGLTMDDFIKATQTIRKELPYDIRDKNARIRNMVPQPTAETVLQKIIPISDLKDYVSGRYQSVIGFVSKLSDSKQLSSFEDLYYGLRLDYTHSKFLLQDKYCYAIRFKVGDNVSNIEVPRGRKFNDPYPFTSTGFTAGKEGRLGIPEFVIPKHQGIDLEDGTEIWEIASDGTQKIIAIRINGTFELIK